MNERAIHGEIIDSRFDNARAYDGVLSRRVFAFLIDYMIVLLLLIPFGILVFLFGIITLGIGWALFGILLPLVAIIYVWTTLGGRKQATLGMRAMDIRLNRLDGRPVDGLLAVVHSVLFWAANVLLTPLTAEQAGGWGPRAIVKGWI